jgi:hypothetical protein
MLVTHLAWAEVRRSFALRSRQKLKGARDFRSLSFLMGLVLAVTTVAVVANGALLDRFSATLLGRIEGAGVPIRVAAHVDQGLAAIDRSVLSCFNDGLTNKSDRRWLFRPTCEQPVEGLAIWPYRAVEEGGLSLRLPGNTQPQQGGPAGADAWRNLEDGGTIRFDGWAVFDRDPVWRAAIGRTAAASTVGGSHLPLTLIVSRERFKENFSFDAYRIQIANQLPFHQVNALPRDLTDPGQLDHLWLEVYIGGAYELVRFEVVWVDSIAAAESLAFLMPASARAAIEQSQSHSGLRYFPEGLGRPVERAGIPIDGERVSVGTIIVSGGARAAERVADEVGPLIGCFNAEAMMGNIDFDVGTTRRTPVPKSWIEECGLPFEPPSKIAEWKWLPNLVIGDPIRVDDDGYLVVPCARLTESDVKQPYNRDCDAPAKDAEGRIDLLSAFYAANVYATDDAELMTTKARLTSMTVEGRRMLRIEPSYDAALSRFDYIQKQLRFAGISVALIVAVIVILQIFNTLMLVVHNRRVNYGVLLADGMSPRRIAAVLRVQVLLSSLFAVPIAAVIMVVIVVIMESAYALLDVGEFGRRYLGVTDEGFMVFSQADLIAVIAALGVIAVLAQVVLGCVLRRLPLRPRTLPVDLHS